MVSRGRGARQGWREGEKGASPPVVMQWLLVTSGPLLLEGKQVGEGGGRGDLMIIMYGHLMMLKIMMIEICHLVFLLCTRCRGFD